MENINTVGNQNQENNTVATQDGNNDASDQTEN